MDKEKIKEIFIEINKYLLYIGLAILFTGIGATYQAHHDVTALNQSLYNIATTNGILTDGTTYYYIGLYQNRYNFSSAYLLNVSQCKAWYGDNYGK